MPRLLLVDDDLYLLQALQKLFALDGHCCETARTAGEAHRYLKASDEKPYDLVVLDVGLPDVDGFSLCRQLRTHHRMPVLFLTARSESQEKIVGLESGADDYVTKPFEPGELLARARALLRRTGEYSRAGEKSRCEILGTVILDPNVRDALRDGAPMGLTAREFQLLQFLVRHRGKALASEWIFENVWGCDADLGLKTLTVYVGRLRQKVEDDPSRPKLIVTVRGYGYKLAPAESSEHMRAHPEGDNLTLAGSR